MGGERSFSSPDHDAICFGGENGGFDAGSGFHGIAGFRPSGLISTGIYP